MRKKAKAKPSSSEQPAQKAPSDPFIEPSIAKLAAQLRSNGKKRPALRDIDIPSELTPFLQSLRLPKLGQALRSDPALYWHPLVVRQVTHLRQLSTDYKTWERLRWEPEVDEDTGAVRHPKRALFAYHLSLSLAKAHLVGLAPGRRVVLKHERRRPGPEAQLKNPYPSGPWSEWVEVAWLDDDERELREVFKSRRRELKRGAETQDQARTRIARLAMQVLEESDVGWWSGWKYLESYVHTPTGRDICEVSPSAPTNPQNGDYWLDISVMPNILKTYKATASAWTSPKWFQEHLKAEAADPLQQPVIFDPRWKPLNLDDPINRMLNDQMGRLEGDGKPAYLAYAVLAALLEVQPEEIRDAIDNYRRPRRRKKTH